MKEILTSSHNSRIQMVRSLLDQTKTRNELRKFVAEGARLIEDGLRSSTNIDFIVYKAELSPRAKILLDNLDTNIPSFQLDTNLFNTLSETSNSQGVMAVFNQPELSPPAHLDFVLILDQIRDPGNLGTILRSAAAAGVQVVYLTPGSTDPFAPKIVRSGMGAHFRLPIFSMDWPGLNALCDSMQIISVDMDGKTPYWGVDLTGKIALLIGGEAQGISNAGRLQASQSLRIPMLGETESLNAAVSTGILLFEVLRQRTIQRKL